MRMLIVEPRSASRGRWIQKQHRQTAAAYASRNLNGNGQEIYYFISSMQEKGGSRRETKGAAFPDGKTWGYEQ